MITQHKHLDGLAIGLLIILCASWGMHQVAIKATLPHITPLWQSSIRSAIAVVLVGAWMAARREPLFERDGTLWPGLAAGVLFGFEFLLIFWGLSFTNVSRSIIFIYTAPFWVALGAHLFIPGETITRIQVIGLLCAFAGVATALTETLAMPSLVELLGDAMILVAALLWGATTVLIKASRLADIAPAKTLFYQLAVSVVILPLGALALGEEGIVSLSVLAVAGLLYQTVWVAFVTYLVWFWMIRRYPASRLSSFTFLTPLFGVLGGGLLLGEPITWAVLVAMVLVGAGIYLVNRPAPEG